jgi:hypothetical protein
VTPRRLNSLGFLIALAVVLSSVPALAARPAASSGSTSTGPDRQSVAWSLGRRSPFLGTRFDGEYFSANRRIYFLGFRTTGDATDGSVWYYNTATGAYTDTGVDMPVPVSNYGIALLRDATGLGMYIFGGRDATPAVVTDVQVYYPATNTTAVIATDPFPGTTPSGCPSMPAMGVAALQNKGYVLGGLSFASIGCVDDQSRQVWVFDPLAPPGSKWSRGRPLNVARGYITSAVLGRTIYAIGGDTISGGTLFSIDTVEAWDPTVAGGWDDAGVADLPTTCDEAMGFGFRTGPLANGVVLAGCGQWPNAIPDTYFYDAAANTWSLAGAFNENRRNHAGALIPGRRPRMYILGGYGEASGFIDPIDSSELGTGMPSGAPSGGGSVSGAAGGTPTN